MTPDEIDNRFSFHAGTKESIPNHERVRELCRTLAHELDELVPVGRERSLALTALQECMMWANAGIALEQSAEKPSNDKGSLPWDNQMHDAMQDIIKHINKAVEDM